MNWDLKCWTTFCDLITAVLKIIQPNCEESYLFPNVGSRSKRMIISEKRRSEIKNHYNILISNWGWNLIFKILPRNRKKNISEGWNLVLVISTICQKHKFDKNQIHLNAFLIFFTQWISGLNIFKLLYLYTNYMWKWAIKTT